MQTSGRKRDIVVPVNTNERFFLAIQRDDALRNVTEEDHLSFHNVKNFLVRSYYNTHNGSASVPTTDLSIDLRTCMQMLPKS